MRSSFSIIFCFILAFLAIQSLHAQSSQTPPATLPNFAFNGLVPGTLVTHNNLKPNKATVVVFFDPTCEHCQQQAQWLHAEAAKFAAVQFLYVSTESAANVMAFQYKYFPNTTLDIQFALDPTYAFDGKFSYSPIPSMYIFGADKRLRKAIKEREVPVTEILEALR